MELETLKMKLISLANKINTDLKCQKLQFHQQNVIKANMSFSGGNGRIYITPSNAGFDVSLSGQSVEKQLYPELINLFGRNNDGYKQTNKSTGKINQPYWRTDDFGLVIKAVKIYSVTGK